MTKKLFVCSIDGPDFSGKTTIASLVVEELRHMFPNVLIKKTHLPSDLVTGMFVKTLRNSKDKVSDEVFALAYAADHLHHDRTFVKNLRETENDTILVQERSLLTTLIYQSVIGKVDMRWVREINKYDANIPDMQIILRITLEEMLNRKKVDQRDFDKFETTEQLKKQRAAYYDFLDNDLKNEFNVRTIDGDGPPKEVAKKCAYQIRDSYSGKDTFLSSTQAPLI